MSTWMKALKNQEILSMSTFKKSEDYMGNQLLTVLKLILKTDCPFNLPNKILIIENQLIVNILDFFLAGSETTGLTTG